MVLAACSNAEPSTSNEATEEDSEQITKEITAETKPPEGSITQPSEESKVTDPETEVSELKQLILVDFNTRYDLDMEYSEPYIFGKFELKDGYIFYADWYFHLEGETFDYATEIFIDRQLVQAQVELKDGVTKGDFI
ncbi:hypothetical protein JOD29_001873 [Lysinibacillus composti]|uniref:Uncharacterized protein n=1 Tax=Lysinibacillus composti TaxID=720633 RepID=A0A3N9UE95_9BACI|nr:hypothetical protein [Lysinibacillus composti]MBM7608626.1 hypothetical protein [Lysinibacillus composti]RQW74547.1 hypothetical protein EBB45_09925 [Lysinibacillus composti]